MTPESGLTVHGNKLLLDDVHFIPQGMCLVAAESFAPPCSSWDAAQAYNVFTKADYELEALHEWNCNTVRFSACQAVIMSQYGASYLQRIVQLVDRALGAGFVVIVQMFDAKSPPCGNNNGNINQQTIDAWARLAPMFQNRPRVMLETCNEPTWEPDANGWQLWHDWNHAAITTIRKSYHSPRPILVQGCHKGMTFAHLPHRLKDQSLVYTVHPYNFAHLTWNQDFGYLVKDVPVIADEWYNKDEKAAVEIVPAFLNQLTKWNVGLLGWVFDSISSQQLVIKANYRESLDWVWSAALPSGPQVKQHFA